MQTWWLSRARVLVPGSRLVDELATLFCDGCAAVPPVMISSRPRPLRTVRQGDQTVATTGLSQLPERYTCAP
jgi:hypothetical protein